APLHCGHLRSSRADRLDPARANPEALAPLLAGGDTLQARPLAFVRQVDSIDDRGERLEADELARLPVGIGGQPDRRDGELRSEQRLDLLSTGLDGEMRPAIGVALQIGKAVVEFLTAQR